MNPYGNVKHGGHGTLTYMRWKSMLQRCNNPKASNYKYYGAVGIKVCERWHDYPSFLTDMGECADQSLTLDRIKSEIGYEPGNCRWITQAEQNGNRPGHARLLTHNGVTQNCVAWAKQLGIKPNNINMRLRLGWSDERILTTPVKGSGQFGDR
jgi:hypothetical protein